MSGEAEARSLTERAKEVFASPLASLAQTIVDHVEGTEAAIVLCFLPDGTLALSANSALEDVEHNRNFLTAVRAVERALEESFGVEGVHEQWVTTSEGEPRIYTTRCATGVVKDAPEETILGPCCECGLREAVGILLLPLRVLDGALGLGQGWGCAVCKIPQDGAMAVLCDSCGAEFEAEREDPDRLPKRAVVGVVGQVPSERVEITKLKEPFLHDPAKCPGIPVSE
mgnify:CR=1 FL=1